MKTRFITVANKQSRGLTAFQESARRFNIEPILLGWNQEWKGLWSKIWLIHEFCKSVGDNDLILFADGFDCLFLSGEEEIVEKFKTFNFPAVFSGENNCHPSQNLHKFPDVGNGFKFLNSGGMMFEAGYMAALLDHWGIYPEKDMRHYFDDQGFFHDLFLLQRAVKIDYNADIWFTWLPWLDYGKLSYTFEGWRLRTNQTGSLPCIVHTPGHNDYNIITRYLHLPDVNTSYE